MSNSTKRTRGEFLAATGGAAALAALSPSASVADALKKRKPCPKPIPTDSVEEFELPFFTPFSEKKKVTIFLHNGRLFDLRLYKRVGGVIGLEDDLSTIQFGNVDLRFFKDPDGTKPTGVMGLPVTNLIVSLAELSLPKQGPYMRVEFEPFVGVCRLGFRLFGTNTESNLVLQAPDNMLVTEKDKTLAANTSTTVYPADYFAGEALVYLNAQPWVTARIVAFDLTCVQYDVDVPVIGGTSRTITMPFGAWAVVVSNHSESPADYGVTVTPNINQKTVIVPQPPQRR
jgi:hypothetical protein